MKTNTTFAYATVFNIAGEVDYASGGIVSKQIIKNQAGNVTLFSFDKEQGLSEHLLMLWYKFLMEKLKYMSEVSLTD